MGTKAARKMLIKLTLVRAEPASSDHQEQPQPGAVVVEKAASNYSGRQEAAATILPKSACPSPAAILAKSVRSGTFLSNPYAKLLQPKFPFEFTNFKL